MGADSTIRIILCIQIFLLALFQIHAVTYVFAAQWSPAVCQSFGKNCYEANVKEKWTIHGLWPPEGYSNLTEEFDIDKLEAVRENLNEVWMNVNERSNNVAFWMYEWNKHGKSAVEDNSSGIANQLEYFSVAIDILKELDLDTKLKECKIEPGITYKADKFVKCFSEKGLNSGTYYFSYKTIPQTSSNKRRKQQTSLYKRVEQTSYTLMELRFCYHGENIKEQRQPTDCSRREVDRNLDLQHTKKHSDQDSSSRDGGTMTNVGPTEERLQEEQSRKRKRIDD